MGATDRGSMLGRVVLVLACALAVSHATEVMYEWSSIEYDWPSDAEKQAAIADGRFVPSNVALVGVKEFDGNLFVGTPRTGDGIPATLSEVVEEGTKALLRPFPSWEASSLSIVAFETDHKGRLYAISRTEKTDQLLIYVIGTRELLRTVDLPSRVDAVSVDDHSRSYTSIRDTDAATVFMLTPGTSSGAGRVTVYTHNHQKNKLSHHPLPDSYEIAGKDTSAVHGITTHNDQCYMSSSKQLYSFRGDEAKVGKATSMYPVASKAATGDLQCVLFHVVARGLVFGRADDSNLYKLSPLSAWQYTVEQNQIKLTADGDLLERVTGLAMDWKYDVIITSTNKRFVEGKINHRISVLPSMELMKQEQAAPTEETDFSDL